MKTEINKSLPGQVILGLAVVGVGVLYLLDNLGLIHFRNEIGFVPIALIVFGVIKLFDTRSPNGYLFGAVLVAIGVFLVLKRLGLPYFNLRSLWPLILIGLGASVIYKALKGRSRIALGMPDGSVSDDSVIDATAILGGFERRITTQNFRGGEATAIMGGCELDLREASIDGEAVLNVVAVLGGITLKTPPDWTVILHGTPILGGFEEKTAKPPHGNKRLIITGYAIMGGVEVRN
ncbi:MAG: DUF5668 domain-containing protein [Pseudomonadota bacterium]